MKSTQRTGMLNLGIMILLVTNIVAAFVGSEVFVAALITTGAVFCLCAVLVERVDE